MIATNFLGKGEADGRIMEVSQWVGRPEQCRLTHPTMLAWLERPARLGRLA